MNKNYKVSIDIRLCLIYFLILNLIILVTQKTTVSWLAITFGIGTIIWFIVFIITLSKTLIIFLKNRKDKNV